MDAQADLSFRWAHMSEGKFSHVAAHKIIKVDLPSTRTINRKEGNDQESLQLPNIFRFQTPKGKKDALKVTAPQSKHYKQKAKRTVSSPKWPNGYPKQNFHQDIHASTYNDRYSKPQFDVL